MSSSGTEIGGSNEAFLAQENQASNTIAGSLHPETLAALQPRRLLTDPAVISIEALENQNHQQSKPSHQSEQDGGPGLASGPTSAAAPIAVPVEVKIKLRQDDPCFSKLNKIMENVLDLDKQIGAFQGEKDSKVYRYLDEMLTRNLLALDGIETAGRDDVRTQRKESVNSINRCVKILESKAKTIQEEKNYAIWSDLAQSTRTEIIQTLIRPDFFAQSSQAGNNTEGSTIQGLPAIIQPQIDPLKTGLLTDPVAAFFSQAIQAGNNTEGLPAAIQPQIDPLKSLDSVEVFIRKILSETK